MKSAPKDIKLPFLAIDKNGQKWLIVEGPYRLTTWRGYKYPLEQQKSWDWLVSMDLEYWFRMG